MINAFLAVRTLLHSGYQDARVGSDRGQHAGAVGAFLGLFLAQHLAVPVWRVASGVYCDLGVALRVASVRLPGELFATRDLDVSKG